MIHLFNAGGPVYMSILTILLLTVLLSVYKFPKWTKEIGLLALTVGILGQVVGLYGVFEGIESMGGNVEQAMIVGGLKISMISMIYGVIIFIVSLLGRLINKRGILNTTP
ncbi:MotA/TolQ/ExbB proton channel family protein [Algoriphagus halophytocola]|uniref:MotA/TolQ/ExbB proton channel family protein n=1 Tax=Algoriphagus halophytocola TaxID=2991499 RepID=UPI0022DCF023|nr:MotA/TolQ/ExbB proton channel family protein [Algoriphagus sp. TR-M9]WBL41729.1 MotA/TolQ/ExbB proton channel family protein [Algoriphagus sp. TR-M9]